MRAIIALMVTLALAACASHGKPITQQQIDSIEEGKTTKQELLASFGEPIAVLKNSDGTEVIGWGYARVGFAGTSYQNQSISVTLDADGKVLRYTTGSVGDSR